MLVVKNKYGRWSTPCSTKDQGGNELTCWLSVQFKRGEEPNNEKANIKVSDFFMSCFNSNDGIKPKLVVMAYSIVERDTHADPNAAIKPDDLPFY